MFQVGCYWQLRVLSTCYKCVVWIMSHIHRFGIMSPYEPNFLGKLAKSHGVRKIAVSEVSNLMLQITCYWGYQINCYERPVTDYIKWNVTNDLLLKGLNWVFQNTCYWKYQIKCFKWSVTDGFIYVECYKWPVTESVKLNVSNDLLLTVLFKLNVTNDLLLKLLNWVFQMTFHWRYYFECYKLPVNYGITLNVTNDKILIVLNWISQMTCYRQYQIACFKWPIADSPKLNV